MCCCRPLPGSNSHAPLFITWYFRWSWRMITILAETNACNPGTDELAVVLKRQTSGARKAWVIVEKICSITAYDRIKVLQVLPECYSDKHQLAPYCKMMKIKINARIFQNGTMTFCKCTMNRMNCVFMLRCTTLYVAKLNITNLHVTKCPMNNFAFFCGHKFSFFN